MSTNTSIRAIVARRSDRTTHVNVDDDNETTERYEDQPLIPKKVKIPKTVTICTLCGRYKGFRLVPKSSRRYSIMFLS